MSSGPTNQMTVAAQGDREIRIEREFNASRERVFAAMTDPEQIPEWWGPRRYETIVDRYEPVTGGHYRLINRSPDGSEEHAFRGVFREVSPPERIVQTFEWEGMPGYVSVETMELSELPGDRTKLVVVSIFHTAEERDGMLGSGMEEGAGQTYERLEELLAAEA